MKKAVPGINIQYPISQSILSGKKTVETRTYPVPESYLDREIAMIETPGRSGLFSARIVAIIKFRKCFKYRSKASFYQDVGRHLVDRKSPWAWTTKNKWGWEVEIVRVFDSPIPLKGPKGIKFTKQVDLSGLSGRNQSKSRL